MDLFALVASDSLFAVEVFVTRRLADEALAAVLRDEPSFVNLLSIEAIAEPELHETELRLYVDRP